MRFSVTLKTWLASTIAAAFVLLFARSTSAEETNLMGRIDPSYRNLSGTNFTVPVPNVEPGQYTAVFGFVETEYNGTGRRLFDIAYGQHLVASNLDVFAAAGGARKLYFLKAPVEFATNLDNGPLAFQFIARKGDAILNSLELKNPSSATVFFLKATDMMGGTGDDAMKPPMVPGPVLWKDPAQPLDTRVKDLVSRMSLTEKVSQLRNGAPPVWRLGVPAYDYWSECLHGVARAGVATVFPQTIGMAATWDEPLIHQIADTIATEARAKHNFYTQFHDGDSARYAGLTFWTPNINLFRDPRWGRGQETYGEDPFLTAQLGVAFIRGLQGDDPKYVKALACAKHFAVHSGPESERHQFDAEPPERDLFESYLPQFEAAVRQGHVGAVMGAYNRLNGEPACSNPFLLTDLLRNQWGFDGHVVSDCGAIEDIYAGHKVVGTPEEAAARAIKAGCDLCCGTTYDALVHAVKMGLVDERQIDRALQHVLTARFRLGLFDPPASVPYAQIPISQNDTPEHEQLALQTARESIVLLKNDGLLPLQRAKIKRIAVIGANADSITTLLGNYNGTPARPVTVLDGIKHVAGDGIEVAFAAGCPLARHTGAADPSSTAAISNALETAKTADVILYVGGLSPNLEGEEMSVNYEGFHGGDRTRIELPTPQTDLLKALHATGKPVVFINCSGSAVAMPWEAANLPAILQAWYPGEAGGLAVAEVLFGDTNPGGRLPVTFYSSTDDLPGFEDYSMANRTYRYFKGTPEFAFGHGLSYTRFDYSKARVNSKKVPATGTLKLSFALKNSGPFDGDEVAQVYVRHVDSKVPQAKLALCGFVRVHVPKKQTASVSLEIPLERFRYWSTVEKRYVVEPGAYELLIGAASDDIRARVPLTIVARAPRP
jgi:beta-glucosidase